MNMDFLESWPVMWLLRLQVNPRLSEGGKSLPTLHLDEQLVEGLASKSVSIPDWLLYFDCPCCSEFCPNQCFTADKSDWTCFQIERMSTESYREF